MSDPANETAVDPTAALASDYVQKRIAGEEADLDWYLERLQDDAERTRFRLMVDGANRIESLLPRQIREGRVLGGRYRIDGELGTGGMGKVFSARDLQLKRDVAVKVLGSLDTDEVDLGRLFARESQLLASLRHPGIVTVHEAAQDGDVQYFVMERVEGVSLDRLLERLKGEKGEPRPAPSSGLDLRAALEMKLQDGGRDLLLDEPWSDCVTRIMIEVARTMEAAHGQGVIHRDLKPGNVMLKGDGHPVLLDFGLGGSLQHETGDLTRRLFGSAAYLAPEQAESGQVGSDVRTDVYQLGLLLYEFLTLRRTFPGEDLSAVLRAVEQGRFKRPRQLRPDIPRDLEAICLKAMELNPARRYSSAREFRADLERHLGARERPRAAGGGPATLLLRDSRYFLRRHKVAAAVASALIVGLICGLAFFGGAEPAGVSMRLVTWNDVEERVNTNPVAVRAGEILGVDIEATGPRWVYAYAVFGSRDNRHQFISPVRPLDEQTGELTGDYERRAEAGSSRFFYSYASQPFEGLVVFALEEPEPILKDWLESMQEECDRAQDNGVSFSQARAHLLSLLDDQGGRRGGRPPREWTERRKEAARKSAERVHRMQESPGTPLFFDHLEHREFFLPLQEQGDSEDRGDRED